jgi:hypothetical protein
MSPGRLISEIVPENRRRMVTLFYLQLNSIHKRTRTYDHFQDKVYYWLYIYVTDVW